MSGGKLNQLTPDQVLQWMAWKDPRAGTGPGAPGGPIQGPGLWQVNLKEVTARLKRHPWIEAVAIERRLPDRLILTIRERVAWARLEGARSYWVSGDGLVLQRAPQEDRRSLPRLVGWPQEGGPGYRPGERIQEIEILRALEILQEARHCPWALQQGIRQVDLSQRERPLAILGNGIRIRFGPTGIRESWTRLQTISNRLRGDIQGLGGAPVGGGDPSIGIDLSFKDLVVVRSFLRFSRGW